MSAVFDTLKYAKRLREGGFTEEQAEALATAQVDVLQATLATKADLAELKMATKLDIAEIKGALTLVQWMLGFNLALSLAMALAAIGPYLAKLFRP
jgi:hypothetical protein